MACAISSGGPERRAAPGSSRSEELRIVVRGTARHSGKLTQVRSQKSEVRSQKSDRNSLGCGATSDQVIERRPAGFEKGGEQRDRFTCEFRSRVCPIFSKAAAMSAVRFLK